MVSMLVLQKSESYVTSITVVQKKNWPVDDLRVHCYHINHARSSEWIHPVRVDCVIWTVKNANAQTASVALSRRLVTRVGDLLLFIIIRFTS